MIQFEFFKSFAKPAVKVLGNKCIGFGNASRDIECGDDARLLKVSGLAAKLLDALRWI